jgi:hypothetical protein
LEIAQVLVAAATEPKKTPQRRRNRPPKTETSTFLTLGAVFFYRRTNGTTKQPNMTNLFKLPFLDGVLYGAFYAAVAKGNKEVVHSLIAAEANLNKKWSPIASL